MSSTSPEAQSAQPKHAQAKDLAASPGGTVEQEKQPANDATSTPQADGVAAAQPTKVEASAPTTDSQAPASAPSSGEPPLPPSDSAPAPPTVDPASAPSSSEKPPLPPSDSAPAPPTVDSDTDPEKVRDPAVITPTEEPPVELIPNPRLEMRKRHLLIVHTRLARFFTWILLLGFVVLPSTFSRAENGNGQGQGGTFTSHKNHIHFPSLFVMGYVCCGLNGLAVGWLWLVRRNDPEWLLTNLFSAGLINAFSGLITTFVNIYGVQSATYGTSTKATLVLVSVYTIIYAILTLVYVQKRKRARYQRRSGASMA